MKMVYKLSGDTFCHNLYHEVILVNGQDFDKFLSIFNSILFVVLAIIVEISRNS